jgi:hypothetical protein
MCMLDAQCTVGQAGQWCLLPTLVACMPMLYLGRRRDEYHCCGAPQAWTTTVARLNAEIVAGREDADLVTPNPEDRSLNQFQQADELGPA